MVKKPLTTRSPYSLERPTSFTLTNLLVGDFSVDDLREATERIADSGNIQFILRLGPPHDVHVSCDIPAQSFTHHHDAVDQYVEKAASFLKESGSPNWVTPLLRERLTSTIGEPPRSSHPIYFISSEKADVKEVVYVGRTAAENGRFEGGHHAITKLHAPHYDGTRKRVYMASVLARITETEWINLELIKPLAKAHFYLSEIEHNLIFALQPSLNDSGKDRLLAKADHLVQVFDPYAMIKATDRVWISSDM